MGYKSKTKAGLVNHLNAILISIKIHKGEKYVAGSGGQTDGPSERTLR